MGGAPDIPPLGPLPPIGPIGSPPGYPTVEPRRPFHEWKPTPKSCTKRWIDLAGNAAPDVIPGTPFVRAIACQARLMNRGRTSLGAATGVLGRRYIRGYLGVNIHPGASGLTNLGGIGVNGVIAGRGFIGSMFFDGDSGTAAIAETLAGFIRFGSTAWAVFELIQAGCLVPK